MVKSEGNVKQLLKCLNNISSAFVVLIDARPKKQVVDDTLAETDVVDEVLPVKNVTKVDGKGCNFNFKA